MYPTADNEFYYILGIDKNNLSSSSNKKPEYCCNCTNSYFINPCFLPIRSIIIIIKLISVLETPVLHQ